MGELLSLPAMADGLGFGGRLPLLLLALSVILSFAIAFGGAYLVVQSQSAGTPKGPIYGTVAP